jgi:transcriptional regulator with GAF, ATPase, and Fis domain
MIVGRSGAIQKVKDQIRQVAETDSSVLLLGETGVGKELVARAIHRLSGRADGPFIPVSIAALPQELAASELFGHEKGAFTGAHIQNKGRFELAHGGTIFLDEIGELSIPLQVKLLRVLQEGVFERLGSSRPIRSDFRVIAATNKALVSEVAAGAFREDLYYRLNVFPMEIPPLRLRRGDISILARYFTDLYARKMGRDLGIPRSELKKLEAYHWPGNVRELKHFIERAVILCDGGDLVLSVPDVSSAGGAVQGQRIGSLAGMEKAHIEAVLEAAGGRVKGPAGAAAILEMKPSTLYYRMKKLGIRRRG